MKTENKSQQASATEAFELAHTFEVEELEDRHEFVHWDKNHEPAPGEEGWVEFIQ